MFTSRAEYRLSLREDNADLRLTEQGRALGLVDDARYAFYQAKKNAVEGELSRLGATLVRPEAIDDELLAKLGSALARECRALELLRRPTVGFDDLQCVAPCQAPWMEQAELAEQVRLQVNVQAKYSGYLKRQSDEIERSAHHESLRLPDDLDYAEVGGLSNEVRQRLLEVRPETLGQAARIPGLTPAAVSLLLVHLKKRRNAA